MQLPPDRSHISTEQPNVDVGELDLHSTKECVALLAKDHELAITAVQNITHELSQFIDATFEKMNAGGRLIYVGCGTSGRLGVLDAAECPPTFQSDPEQIIGLIAGGDASLRVSSEAKEDMFDGVAPEFDRIQLRQEDVVLGIAAGGTTPWVLGGLQEASRRGATTGFLTCSKVDPIADFHLYLETGPEPVTGSTRLKAGTATKVVLNIISTTVFTKLGKVYGNTMVDLKASNAKLRDRAIRIVSTLCNLDRQTAATLLDSAEGDVKTAIVMHTLDVDRKTAKEKLNATSGNLRRAL